MKVFEIRALVMMNSFELGFRVGNMDASLKLRSDFYKKISPTSKVYGLGFLGLFLRIGFRVKV
jgi:hypothetical protein